MLNNDAEYRDPPKTKSDAERGGSGTPPRPTAVGSCDFGEFHWFKKMRPNDCFHILFEKFKNMTRIEQERIITSVCQLTMIGCAAMLTVFFYPFLYPLTRLALPVFIILAWFVGNNVLGPIVICQLEDKLVPKS